MSKFARTESSSHKSEECKFYKNGYCRNGAKCSFKHNQTLDLPWRFNSLRSRNASGDSGINSPTPEARTPEIKYQDEKAADLWSTDDNYDSIDSEKSCDLKNNARVLERFRKGAKICRHFVKGCCAYGPRCQFLHPTHMNERAEEGQKTFPYKFSSVVELLEYGGWADVQPDDLYEKMQIHSCQRALLKCCIPCDSAECLMCSDKPTYDLLLMVIEGWSALCSRRKADKSCRYGRGCCHAHTKSGVELFQALIEELNESDDDHGHCWTFLEKGVCHLGEGIFCDRYKHDFEERKRYEEDPDSFTKIACFRKVIGVDCSGCKYSHDSTAVQALQERIKNMRTDKDEEDTLKETKSGECSTKLKQDTLKETKSGQCSTKLKQD